MLNFISQTNQGSCCGQIAVAVLTGSTLDKVVQIVGHKHGTRTKELRAAFNALGFDCPVRRPIVKRWPDVPGALLIHIRENNAKKYTGHWVAVCDYVVYDGNGEAPYGLKDYEYLAKEQGWRITSSMPV